MDGSKATSQIGDNSFKSRVRKHQPMVYSIHTIFHLHHLHYIYKKTKDSFFLHGVTNLLCYEVKTDGRKHFYKHDYILKKSFIFVAYLL